MTTAESGPAPIPPLFIGLVDDTSLLAPLAGAPAVDAVLAAHLAARDDEHGAVVGQLACPVSRLSALVAELARLRPTRPVELSLVVDTGLGAVPKALSTAFSRPGLLTPRAVQTAAPPDVDPVWLERVAEFVPDDVMAVVEPRRPTVGSPDATATWLAAVRRVAEHGCTPKLRCGGPRASDEPGAADVERFVQVVADAGRTFTAMGLRRVVRPPTADGPAAGGVGGEGPAVDSPAADGPAAHRTAADGPPGPGILNLLVAVTRVLDGGDPGQALRSTDGRELAAELAGLEAKAAQAVRGLLARCGADGPPTPARELVGLGLLT